MNQALPQANPNVPLAGVPNRGRLHLFVGAWPGVAMTEAMLSAARERQRQGERILAWRMDSQLEIENKSLFSPIEILPTGDDDHLDLDTALRIRPDRVLIEKPATLNPPGSRHASRHQDIEELLAAGINVYCTLDIRHLESLNDLVLKISGILIRETVPDRFLDVADELIYVDQPVTSAGTVVSAVTNTSWLAPGYESEERAHALRELAMREVVQRLERLAHPERESQAAPVEYILHDKLLVLVSSQGDHEYLVRAGKRLADKRRIDWTVLWVDDGHTTFRAETTRIQSALALAAQLGARTEILRGIETLATLIPFINAQRFNIVLVGAGPRRLLGPLRKPLHQGLIDCGLPLEVIVYRPPEQELATTRLAADAAQMFSGGLREHAYGVFLSFIATIFAVLLDQWLSSGNLVLIYVLAVMITGLKYGAGPAMTAAALAFLSFDFFLAQPIFSFFPTQQDDIATMMFLVVIALLCGAAASHLRRQFLLLDESNRYTESLRALGQKLTIADTERSVWLTLAGELTRVLSAEVCLVIEDAAETVHALPAPRRPFAAIDVEAVQWTRKHSARSGRLTETLVASDWTFFPVIRDARCIAVVAIRFNADVRLIKPYERDLIGAMLSQAAEAWERVQLTLRLESAHLKTEVEQLRSALLSSVSHDLKSPLSAMIGAAETLNLHDARLAGADRHELTDTILQESRRLESYIQNLLDMTRLGHGKLQIKRDWVPVDDIIGAAMTRLRRYFPGREIEYLSAAPDLLLYVQAVLIEQAVYNILENAAKYSPAGQPIRIRVGQQAGKCLIDVEDSGPGIPESLREKIFDMFYAVAQGDQKSQNTGMGLAICRGMITAHGGRVTARAARDGHGTCFTIELPIDEPEAAVAE